MATAHTTYYCDKCRAGYQHMYEAEACENKHWEVDSVKQATFDPNDKNFPSKVNIKFKNGDNTRVISYYKKGGY